MCKSQNYISIVIRKIKVIKKSIRKTLKIIESYRDSEKQYEVRNTVGRV